MDAQYYSTYYHNNLTHQNLFKYIEIKTIS